MLLVAGALFALNSAAAPPPKVPQAASSSRSRSELSYALGYAAGLDLSRREPNVDIGTVVRGVGDGYARKTPEYSPQDMQRVIQAMEKRMIAKAREEYRKLAATNLERSRAFFSENKKKQGVITLASGVEYEVLKESDNGGGKSPAIDSQVTLQLRAEFLDGTIFSNTEDSGKPVMLPVKYMVPGFRQVMMRMHVGDHWKVFIPPDLAYGIRGNPPLIGPNETLVFDIQLLGINAAQKN